MSCWTRAVAERRAQTSKHQDPSSLETGRASDCSAEGYKKCQNSVFETIYSACFYTKQGLQRGFVCSREDPSTKFQFSQFAGIWILELLWTLGCWSLDVGSLRSLATCIVLQFGPFFNDCTSMKLSETQCLHIDAYIVNWLHYGLAVPAKQFPILVDWLPHQRSPIPAQHPRD